MLQYTNTTSTTPQGSNTYAATNVQLRANNLYIFPWIATARDLTKGGDTQFGFPAEDATRTSNSVYMKGLRENISFTTQDGTPWRWRRVCFTMKGPVIAQLSTNGYLLYNELNYGYARVMNSVRGTPIDTAFADLMFKGQPQQDWISVMEAPLDTNRISVKYDKTRTFNGGNQTGMARSMKMWHPMEKRLVYNDDEAGAGETTSVLSTFSKQGMGDYYIVDFIEGTGTDAGPTTPQAYWRVNSTLYWHEK